MNTPTDSKSLEAGIWYRPEWVCQGIPSQPDRPVLALDGEPYSPSLLMIVNSLKSLGVSESLLPSVSRYVMQVRDSGKLERSVGMDVVGAFLENHGVPADLPVKEVVPSHLKVPDEIWEVLPVTVRFRSLEGNLMLFREGVESYTCLWTQTVPVTYEGLADTEEGEITLQLRDLVGDLQEGETLSLLYCPKNGVAEKVELRVIKRGFVHRDAEGNEVLTDRPVEKEKHAAALSTTKAR